MIFNYYVELNYINNECRLMIRLDYISSLLLLLLAKLRCPKYQDGGDCYYDYFFFTEQTYNMVSFNY